MTSNRLSGPMTLFISLEAINSRSFFESRRQHITCKILWFSKSLKFEINLKILEEVIEIMRNLSPSANDNRKTFLIMLSKPEVSTPSLITKFRLICSCFNDIVILLHTKERKGEQQIIG